MTTRSRTSSIIAAASLVLLARSAGAQEVAPVATTGIHCPLRDLGGADLAEPFLPLAAASRGDWGRIVLGSAVPYALLASAFACESSDPDTLIEIGRWRWVGLDETADNYPLLYGFVGLAGLSVFLPSPGDRDGYSWQLRIDRATVFALGMGLASLEPELFKPIFHRRRPNGNGNTSRPSGHASAAFAAMAFFSDVLRDTFRPQDEENLGRRILFELASAIPYLGAGYIALERVHANKHFLTDTLLGGAIGALTMHLFYAWFFTRTEEGRGWIETASVGYDPVRRGFELAVRWSF